MDDQHDVAIDVAFVSVEAQMEFTMKELNLSRLQQLISAPAALRVQRDRRRAGVANRRAEFGSHRTHHSPVGNSAPRQPRQIPVCHVLSRLLRHGATNTISPSKGIGMEGSR